MDIVEYTLFLVKSIVKEDDLVSVKEIGSDEETINLEILVKESDMGSVIGKSGNVLKALRTMVQAYSYLHDKKKVKLNIEAF